MLDNCSTVRDLEDEIEWLQDTLIDILNQHTKVVTTCARPKRWWNDEIRKKRRVLGRAVRRRRAGRGGEAEVKRARAELRREVRKSRRECWENFLSDANGEDVWAITRYGGPGRSTVVPTITHRGVVVETREDKAEMLTGISFPPLTPYDGHEGQEGPPGTAFHAVDEYLVARAFWGTSKKSPGPDGIGPLAIACVYEWDPDRIVALLRAHIRFGYHPAKWKVARGATIPKPGRDDYGLAKSYRCISLLNCLGKMVEKVAAMLVSAHCER